MIFLRLGQYTGTQRDVTLPDRKMVPGRGRQGPSERPTFVEGQVSISIGRHIAGTSLSRISGVPENRLRFSLRKARTGYWRQSQGGYRHGFGCSYATRKEGSTVLG